METNERYDAVIAQLSNHGRCLWQTKVKGMGFVECWHVAHTLVIVQQLGSGVELYTNTGVPFNMSNLFKFIEDLP